MYILVYYDVVIYYYIDVTFLELNKMCTWSLRHTYCNGDQRYSVKKTGNKGFPPLHTLWFCKDHNYITDF